MSGIRFEIYAAEDIINPSDGEILYKKGTIVEAMETNDDGYDVFTGD